MEIYRLFVQNMRKVKFIDLRLMSSARSPPRLEKRGSRSMGMSEQRSWNLSKIYNDHKNVQWGRFSAIEYEKTINLLAVERKHRPDHSTIITQGGNDEEKRYWGS